MNLRETERNIKDGGEKERSQAEDSHDPWIHQCPVGLSSPWASQWWLS